MNGAIVGWKSFDGIVIADTNRIHASKRTSDYHKGAAVLHPRRSLGGGPVLTHSLRPEEEYILLLGLVGSMPYSKGNPVDWDTRP